MEPFHRTDIARNRRALDRIRKSRIAEPNRQNSAGQAGLVCLCYSRIRAGVGVYYSKDPKFIKLGEKLQALRDKHEFVGEIMIILVTGASHTGKTALAQKLLEKYKYPYLSIDHLKMGLIRSGNTELTPMDDNELTEYLWPIVCEMIKTAIENKQNLIVEGGYIPFDWQKDFDSECLKNIKYYCLVMTEKYIRNHFADIKKYANVIENRLDDEWCTMESVLADNLEMLTLAREHNVNYILIDDKYEINIEL